MGLDYKALPGDVKSGDTLLLNDGLIVLTVERVAGSAVHTMVKVGGELSNNKGINKLGGGLTAPALTAKDMEDIKTAMSFEADYVAVSFPKNGTDMDNFHICFNLFSSLNCCFIVRLCFWIDFFHFFCYRIIGSKEDSGRV